MAKLCFLPLKIRTSCFAKYNKCPRFWTVKIFKNRLENPAQKTPKNAANSDQKREMIFNEGMSSVRASGLMQSIQFVN